MLRTSIILCLYSLCLVLYYIEWSIKNLILLQECCESGEDCVLDLLDYCQRSIARLLVQGEGGGRGKMVDSEGSSSEDEESDGEGENVPSKKKILTVDCECGSGRWLERGRGRERERKRERETERTSLLIQFPLLSLGAQRTGANPTVQRQYEGVVDSQIHQWPLISVSCNYLQGRDIVRHVHYQSGFHP